MFLNVGRQIQQVHDLSEPGTADVTKSGQFGLVGDGAVAKELIEMDEERCQPDISRVAQVVVCRPS
jgi:hypothetical protein